VLCTKLNLTRLQQLLLVDIVTTYQGHNIILLCAVHHNSTTTRTIMNCHRTFATTSGASFAFFAQHPHPSQKTVEAFAASVTSSSSSSSPSRPIKRSESSHSCCSIRNPSKSFDRRRASEDTIETTDSYVESSLSLEYVSFPKSISSSGSSDSSSIVASSSSSAQV
jgi:hypothetical protein